MGLCGNGAGPDEILISGSIGQVIAGGFMFQPIDYPGRIQITRSQVVITNPKTGRSTIRIKKTAAIEKGLADASVF